MIRTLVTTAVFDVVRESVTKTNAIDFDSGGTIQLFSRSARPYYKFTLKLEPLVRYTAEQLEMFHAEHQGSKSFFCDCPPYNTVENFQRVATADGVTTQFFLPNRWIGANTGANSLSLQTRNQATQATSQWSTSAYSVNVNPGILLFSTIPSSGFDIEAKWSCTYRLVFDPDGMKIAEWARGVYRAELNLREVFLFTT